MSDFNHFDGKGNAIMVDVSSKEITERIAVASCDVHINPSDDGVGSGRRHKKR